MHLHIWRANMPRMRGSCEVNDEQNTNCRSHDPDSLLSLVICSIQKLQHRRLLAPRCAIFDDVFIPVDTCSFCLYQMKDDYVTDLLFQTYL